MIGRVEVEIERPVRRGGRFDMRAGVTSSATFVLIGVGGLVRATDSGLGCPDWPGCSTTWDVHAVIEYSHRTLAGVVMALVVAVAVAAWRARRDDRIMVIAAVSAAVLVFAQAALGGLVVLLELQARLVTLHLSFALALAGLTVFIAERALRGPIPTLRRAPPGAGAMVFRAALLAAGAVFAQMLLGSWVTGRGAGLAFIDFPLMDGSLVPPLSAEAEQLHFAHRLMAVVVIALVLVAGFLAFRASRESGDRGNGGVRTLAVTAAGLVVVQVALGAANVWSRLAPAFVVAHLVGGALLWGVLVALALGVRRLAALPVLGGSDRAAEVTERNATRAAREKILAYVRLTKPRIIQLLLVTTLPTMLLAERGVPSPWLIAATLGAGTLAAGSANAINSYIDRRIDQVMRRTRGRPLPRNEIPPRAALAFGIGLGVLAFGWLWLAVNPLAAALGVAAILFYVFVYTLWMKRTTPQNIVIGGAAGCVPVLVGWAAVTGSVQLPALVLFAIVFYWTPPHFWALALRYQGDYAAARVPMLPVVRGAAETSRQIVLYSLLLVAVTLLLVPAAGMGLIYLAAAVALGGVFLAYAVWVWRQSGAGRAPIQLFRYSISYLTLLFAAIGLDSLVRVPLG